MMGVLIINFPSVPDAIDGDDASVAIEFVNYPIISDSQFVETGQVSRQGGQVAIGQNFQPAS